MKDLLKKTWVRTTLFILAGSVMGFSYYYFIGCTSGSCAISSNPYVSTGYGMMIGLFLSFNKGDRKEKQAKEAEGDE